MTVCLANGYALSFGMFKKIFYGFRWIDYLIWVTSVAVVIITSAISGFENVLSLLCSLLGVTGLIFCAKGNIYGHIVSVFFALFYGIISATFRYWGEMITYLCMSLPMDIIAVITWFKNRYKGSEVKVASLTLGKALFAIISGIIVTIIMYFVLKALNTPNLIFSTVSVLTSWIAVVFVAMRSSYYAVAYGLNDVVLIVLWVLASVKDVSYIPMVACFIMFLVNDVYGFINWTLMEKKQKKFPVNENVGVVSEK